MGGWIGGLAHPALIAGLALGAVPILIHLLNRQRHKPVPWAAMRFVLAAYRKTRRRVQLENLLLLLLRTAAVLFFAFAITRPFTGESSPLASLTEGRRDLVLIVDGSASMGWRDGVESVFERAVKRGREVVRKLKGGRGDRVRLVFAGNYPRLLSWTTPENAASMLDTLVSPTDEPLDLAAALTDVLQQAKTAPGDGPALELGKLEVLVLSDLQARAFRPEDPSVGATDDTRGRPSRAGDAAARDEAAPPDRRTALVEVLEQLDALGVRVVVEGLAGSSATPPNLGVVGVSPLQRVASPGQPTEIGVEVANWGTSQKSGVRVVLEVDGERRPNQTVDVPARGRAQVVFPVAFKNAGEHVVTARLDEGDALAVDNRRTRVLSVPPAVRVLFVNGAPGAVIEEDETGYLRAVVEPTGDDLSAGGSSPFEPREIPADELSAPDLDFTHYDVIWLANVESVPAPVVDKLEAAIAGGRALIVSLGDRVDATATNARLYRADGSGLLPAALDERVSVRSRSEGYFRVKAFDESHPALAFFSDERFKPLLTEIPIYEFVSTRPLPGARALATLDDDAAHALLLERPYDRGKVFLWTSTIDPLWTRLPESPATLVPLVHEWLRYAASAEEPSRNVAPGTPLAAETTQFPRNLVLVRPDGTRRPLDGEALADTGGRWKLPPVPGKDTETAGLYRIEMDGGRAISFAVDVDPAEGDLERVSIADLRAMPAIRAPDEEATNGDTQRPDARGELWRPLAIAALLALIGESLWAAWLGRKRSVR